MTINIKEKEGLYSLKIKEASPDTIGFLMDIFSIPTSKLLEFMNENNPLYKIKWETAPEGVDEDLGLRCAESIAHLEWEEVDNEQ